MSSKLLSVLLVIFSLFLQLSKGNTLTSSDCFTGCVCDPGEPCIINCDTIDGCKNVKEGLDAGDATSLTVNCIRERSCEILRLDCGSAETCTVNCDIGTEADSCKSINVIYCRTSVCVVNCHNDNQCYGFLFNIYAANAHSFQCYGDFCHANMIAAEFTREPTPQPTAQPTPQPTTQPSTQPTDNPTTLPPSTLPTTSQPSAMPTNIPSDAPTTAKPSKSPTDQPSVSPTNIPSLLPTTQIPSTPPTTAIPTTIPSNMPSGSPTTQIPSTSPSDIPTKKPTFSPTNAPVKDAVAEDTTTSIPQQNTDDGGSDDLNANNSDLDSPLSIIISFVCGVLFVLCIIIIGCMLYRKKVNNKLKTETAHSKAISQTTNEKTHNGDDYDIVGIIDLKRDQHLFKEQKDITKMGKEEHENHIFIKDQNYSTEGEILKRQSNQNDDIDDMFPEPKIEPTRDIFTKQNEFEDKESDEMIDNATTTTCGNDNDHVGNQSQIIDTKY